MTEILRRGDDYAWTWLLRTKAKTPYDLTGCRLDFTIKPLRSDITIFEHWIAFDTNGFVYTSYGLTPGQLEDDGSYTNTDPSTGILTQELQDEDKTALSLVGTGRYDIQLTDARGKIKTLLTSTMSVVADIT